MTREIVSDFVLLKAFLDNYRLDSIGRNPEQLNVVKAAHKSYLPFLQFWAVSSDEASRGNFNFFAHPIVDSGAELAFLRETVSDIGSGFFCCLHGAYKPGHMALRSGIENFIRFASSPFDRSALTTTSIYELFDLARRTTPFSDPRKIYLDQLRNCYVELCKFSHSATLAHMAGIHALAHFPSFDEKAFQGWLDMARICMSSMVTVTVLGAPAIYLDAHFLAKEMMDHLIPRAERIYLLRGSRP